MSAHTILCDACQACRDGSIWPCVTGLIRRWHHGRLVELGTAAQVAAYLGPDVTPAMVRRWAERDGLAVYRLGRTVYYRLDQAATIEARKAASGRGRPRAA